MANNLARINWKLGQALLPEHFWAQEESLINHNEFRFRLNGLPHYGLIELKWRQQILDDGILSLEKFSYKTPGGLLVSIPDNARIAAPLNLDSLGSSSCEVYCHILDPIEVNTDIKSELNESFELCTSVYVIHLSTDQEHPEAIESIKIAAFDKSPEGVWTISNKFSPPILLLGMSPYFSPQLKELNLQLQAFKEALINDSAINNSTEASLSNRHCLEKVFHLQFLLNNLDKQIKTHPYQLYEKLLQFHITCCNYYNSQYPNVNNFNYEHNNLAYKINELIDLIQSNLQQVKAKAPYQPFILEEGRYICRFDASLRKSNTIYLLIQKNHIKDNIDLSKLKLVSAFRSITVHKMALPGIPYNFIDNVPFQHPFGAEVDFYQLTLGEEWDFALQDLTLCFYTKEDINFSAYLYWRSS
jgi:type VI secretion system protein ImpJ